MSGSGISWAVCKSAPRSRLITMPAPHHSVFLQAGCPSCRPTNSVKALSDSTHVTLCHWHTEHMCDIMLLTHGAQMRHYVRQHARIYIQHTYDIMLLTHRLQMWHNATVKHAAHVTLCHRHTDHTYDIMSLSDTDRCDIMPLSHSTDVPSHDCHTDIHTPFTHNDLQQMLCLT